MTVIGEPERRLRELGHRMQLWCIDNSGHYHEDDIEELVATWLKELDAVIEVLVRAEIGQGEKP